MKTFISLRDANGNDTGIREASDFINKKTLAANVAERDTIPSGADIVLFSSTSSFYALAGTSGVTAAIGTDVSDGTASELNPAAYVVQTGVTHISIISPAVCDVTLSYYRRGF